MAFKRSAVRSRLSPPIENVESMQTLRFAWIFCFENKWIGIEVEWQKYKIIVIKADFQ